MEIDKESLEEFKQIWEKEFGETLTEGEAKIIAGQLMELYAVLYLEREERLEEDSQ